MNTHPAEAGLTFYGLGIAPNILSVLERAHFTTPTPIQQQAIAPAIEGKDVIDIAQTGTGKTLAFCIPTIQRLLSTRGTALVLLPTRELALQVEETFRKIGEPLHLKTAVLIGGASMSHQITALRRNPAVVIATPGRLIDHVRSRTIRFDTVAVLILDEADRMLDMGFLPQMREILRALPEKRQTMLFSATLSAEILAVAKGAMRLPFRVEVAPSGTTAEGVTQEFFMVRREDKSRLLEKVLAEYRGSTLVFTRTKHGAKKLARLVRAMGHLSAEIHGNRSQNQRKDALEGFKTGKYRVLIATDIASRGIDVQGIELVINYDLPMQTADYVHRIGRTARAGAKGHAISFALPDEARDIRAIERLMRKSVRISHLPELPPARHVPHHDAHARSPYHAHTPRGHGRRRPFAHGFARR